jgi:hypothetical protein
MAEFKISRLRYTWKGEWVTETRYLRDDVVSYQGSSWVCIKEHDSTTFNADLTFTVQGESAPRPAWVKMTEGNVFRGPWQASTLYEPGAIVKYGGNLYIAVNSHTSTSTFDDDLANWSIYSASYNWLTDWDDATRYAVGDVVRYGGIVYICTQGHLSGTPSEGLELDQDKWVVYYSNIEFKGDYAADTRYKVNDLVLYNGSLLRCTEGYTSQANYDQTKWQIESQGSEFIGEWDSSTEYGIGSVVRYGGYSYYCIAPNLDKSPINSIYQSDDQVYWQILSKSYNFRGEWFADQSYRTGDVVRRGGILYVALLDNTAQDGSSLDYLDTSNWEILTVSQNWRNFWAAGSTYRLNDIVLFEGNTYICTVEHDSDTENFPGNGSGFIYWDLIIQAGSEIGLKQSGDLLTYDLSRRFGGDFSTFGLTNVEIGEEDELLTIDSEDRVFYKTYGNINRVVYVDLTGVDDTSDVNRGYNPFKPWRTVRYAAEQVNDNFNGTTTIRVGPGEFTEILPIIIPARTVIQGSELRSTSITAAGPVAALENDSTYTNAALQRLSNIIEDLFLGNLITPSSGNDVEQILPGTIQVQIGEDIVGTPIFSEISGASDSATASLVRGMISDIRAYISFYVEGEGESAPTVTGSNTAASSQAVANAIRILNLNTEFLAEEAIKNINTFFPEYEFDGEECKQDVRDYIKAWIYDLTYTGNYRSVLAARYYRNAVLGSATDDMFYCRDTTGVRNCTLKGLTGTLNPPNVFDLYRRPTGGAYCSLDPGWGPDDQSVWIINRSPYIQGVTTFGFACVGQKIDGALHNGGNRSIVSNDFTQVLSDGIGAYVLNNGRAELVSVFTYYCAVGYLAEDGGIIRATNGNCSYGRYGAISDGVSADEVPTTASVNNRAGEAVVATAFAGDFTDELQILEWSNAGANYTQATATFRGAGINAEVKFEDFRDDAVFQARLLDTSTDPIAQTIGGSGYSIQQNNAQTHLTPGGDLVGITLAVSDSNEAGDYIGKRIIIVGGTGTGQYGYITAYNSISKVASVSRESNDDPGWDHVFPGTPIASLLDTTTLYRIEPRVTFSDPPFVAEEITIPTATNWSAINYGETAGIFNNLSATIGSGETVDIAPVAARFNVVKSGKKYTVTLVSAGAGYNVGDETVILGTSLGGSTPDNDLTFTVTAVSDDSTNSILDFEFTGVGGAGKFVLLSTGGSAALYSGDAGENWTQFNMPSSGDWTSLASVTEPEESLLTGEVSFVAIRNNSNVAASSLDGVTWTSRTMPNNRLWNAVVYGGGKFVAVAGNLNGGAYSTNGISWTAADLPAAGDSTTNEWVDIAYGKNLFVALSNSNNFVAYSSDGINWDTNFIEIEDSTSRDWVSIAYGSNKFVAISSQGDYAYSFDAVTWYSGIMPSIDGSSQMSWRKIKYAQGVFFAICDTGGRSNFGDITAGPTTFAATSQDGLTWRIRELATELEWRTIGFGNPYIQEFDSTVGKSTPTWIASGLNTNKINRIKTGARALGRVTVNGGVISQIKLWDPGSGYIEDNATVTVFDPNSSSDPAVECRKGDGVIGVPSWINRGFGYRTQTTRVTITGDGYGDEIPAGKFLTISGLEFYPGPGAQVLFAGNSTIYTLVAITELGDIDGNGLSATFRVSPDLKVRDQIEHDTVVTIRTQYSQCRITGHDFLDIGTGNFEETNYPELYATGLYQPTPENEVYEESGGRVFYTSTDQSGNFRCGELFGVEQATGIVTISAEFFDFSGLTEIRLGGVRLGGTGVVVREFSTDPLFTEDSNNIVPTQRAISRYLANRLSVGGAEISTLGLTAGLVVIGPDKIDHTVTGTTIVIEKRADFEGSGAHVSGSMLAQTIFFRSFY